MTDIRRSELIANIDRRKLNLTVLEAYMSTESQPSAKSFRSFAEALPGSNDLEALCWTGHKPKIQFRVGRTELCENFDVIEPDKILPQQQLLMQSIYIRSDSGTEGFMTIFMNLRDLLSLSDDKINNPGYLLIYNNDNQTFSRISHGSKDLEILQTGFLNADLVREISRMGRFDLFYQVDALGLDQPDMRKPELVICLLTCLFIIASGFFLGHVLSTRNEISRQVRLKTSELEAASSEAQKLKMKAEELANHKQKFLANMSHEIRTPMNGVLGVIQLLDDEELNDKQKQYLQVIAESGELMVGILNDILDQSKIEADMIELETVPCSVVEIIESVCGLFRSAAVSKGISIDFDVDPSLPKYVQLDPLRMKQIVTNLVSNSIKFTPTGSIRVVARQIPNKRLEVSVYDTGIGIDQDRIDRVFDEFLQVDNSTTRKYGGTGLGLSIAYRLVGLMGGKIDVQSKLGEGSRFFFSIPIEKATFSETHQKMTTLPSHKDTTDFNDLKLLVVEDNAVNAMVILRLLKKLQISADLVGDGASAVSKVEDGEYDIVLMDCHMPVMDGIEATRQIRRGPRSEVIIIALSAGAMKEDKQACYDVGMNDYLTKQILKDVLKNNILKWSLHNKDNAA